MAQPYNYTLPNPMMAFEQAYNFSNEIAARNAAQAKAAEEKARAQQAQEALMSVANDRSPENIARVLLFIPALKEQITASESILNEDQIKSDNSFRAEVISLFKSNPDAARARLVKQADGYANTIGKEEQAAAAASLLKAFDENPDAVILPMTIQLAQSDEKLYKTLFDATEGYDTPFLKELRAEGLLPGTPEFKAALTEKRQGDPWLAVPGVGLFLKKDLEIAAGTGQEAVSPQIPQGAVDILKQDPSLAAEFNKKYGTKTNPNPAARIIGGQTGETSPSGNFR